MIPLTQLPTIAKVLPLLKRICNFTFASNSTPPHPTIWQTLHNSSEWIYKYGSFKHIMRTELVAIYVALEKK